MNLVMSAVGTFETCRLHRAMSASLIGHWGQALSDHPPPQCRCRSRARASLRNRHQGPSIIGFEDEVEQSLGRPCRLADSRSKRTYELTSSIVPRGTSFLPMMARAAPNHIKPRWRFVL